MVVHGVVKEGNFEVNFGDSLCLLQFNLTLIEVHSPLCRVCGVRGLKVHRGKSGPPDCRCFPRGAQRTVYGTEGARWYFTVYRLYTQSAI